MNALEALQHPYLEDFFDVDDLKVGGSVEMEVDDSVALDAD